MIFRSTIQLTTKEPRRGATQGGNLANKVWLLIPRSDWSGLFSLRSPFTEETEPGFTEKTTIVGRSFAKRSYRSARSFDSMLDSFSLPLHPSI